MTYANIADCRKQRHALHVSMLNTSSLANTVASPSQTTWRWRAAFAISRRDRTLLALIPKPGSLCRCSIHVKTTGGLILGAGVDFKLPCAIEAALILNHSHLHGQAENAPEPERACGDVAFSALVGKRIPQVAQGTVFTNNRFNVQGRSGSLPYDDDLNTFPLEGFFVFDAFAARSIGSTVELFIASENLANRKIQVTRTAVLLGLGMPRTVRAGRR